MVKIPHTNVIESMTNVLLQPTPPMKFLMDPNSRKNVILHDKIYKPDSIPRRTLPRTTTTMLDSLDPGKRHKILEERIARRWHKGMTWRKVLVNLLPDAHNNMVVRRRFANAYGWPVIDHLVEEHFGEKAFKGEDYADYEWHEPAKPPKPTARVEDDAPPRASRKWSLSTRKSNREDIEANEQELDKKFGEIMSEESSIENNSNSRSDGTCKSVKRCLTGRKSSTVSVNGPVPSPMPKSDNILVPPPLAVSSGTNTTLSSTGSTTLNYPPVALTESKLAKSAKTAQQRQLGIDDDDDKDDDDDDAFEDEQDVKQAEEVMFHKPKHKHRVRFKSRSRSTTPATKTRSIKGISSTDEDEPFTSGEDSGDSDGAQDYAWLDDVESFTYDGPTNMLNTVSEAANDTLENFKKTLFRGLRNSTDSSDENRAKTISTTVAGSGFESTTTTTTTNMPDVDSSDKEVLTREINGVRSIQSMPSRPYSHRTHLGSHLSHIKKEAHERLHEPHSFERHNSKDSQEHHHLHHLHHQHEHRHHHHHHHHHLSKDSESHSSPSRQSSVSETSKIEAAKAKGHRKSGSGHSKSSSLGGPLIDAMVGGTDAGVTNNDGIDVSAAAVDAEIGKYDSTGASSG
ncbi:unnamed protein product [Ambrosiozyma monospora]|uniref:Unnamed protein product n=1 Tax=Ambrosiozyma monospora TaxID=43982 RepID=A0A9W6YUL5_AMBMO|nr:unnamed protein product [Ambrosiozyma monospora]